LANTPQTRKRARQNVVRRLHNRSLRSRLRTSLRGFLKTAEGSDRKAAETAYREAVSVIDSMVNKRIHHRNRAARLKSRLNERLRHVS
jgi:small subunit ribosomal protein S20